MFSQVGHNLSGVSYSHNPHRGPPSPDAQAAPTPQFLRAASQGPLEDLGLGSTPRVGVSEVYGAGRVWEPHHQVASTRDSTGKPVTTHGSQAQPSVLPIRSVNSVLYKTCVQACVDAKSLKSCPTLCDPMDCSPPGSSVHGILQARILEWVAIFFSGRLSRPRDLSQVSCTAGRFSMV